MRYRFQKTVCALALLLSSGLVCAESAKAQETPITAVAVPPPQGAILELTPQVSIVSPSEFTLRNGKYEVAYASNFSGVPTINLALSTSILRLGSLQVMIESSAGYGTKQGSFEVTPLSDLVPVYRQAAMRLHWIPLGLAAKFRYNIPGTRWLIPTLTIGGGTHMMLQSGPVADLDHTFWVPYVCIKPAVTFMDEDPTFHWFGGFTFGTTFHRSTSSRHNVAGISFDLSLNLIL